MTQVDAVVREAAERFKALGATVDTVSIPMHRDGSAIWLPIAAEGALMQMMLGNGFGFNWQGLYVTSMLDFHSGWKNRADELSDTLKNTMLLGHYMATRYRGRYYAKAQNLVRRLRRAYDEGLARCDLLLMPEAFFNDGDAQPGGASAQCFSVRLGRGAVLPRVEPVRPGQYF